MAGRDGTRRDVTAITARAVAPVGAVRVALVTCPTLCVNCERCGRSGRDRAVSCGQEERRPSPQRPPCPQPPPAADARLGSDPIRVLIADDHALFRRGLEMVLQGEAGLELVGQASDGAGGGAARRRGRARRRADGHPDAEDHRHRGRPADEGGRAVRQDRDADDQRRGGGPLRGDPRGRERLPAQGHPARRAGRLGARRARRPVPHQPVDGGQAAHRVRHPGPPGRRG